MITTPEEYQKYLFQIQDENFPKKAILLPTDETIYNVNLNERTIEAPEILSAKDDHFAETIYFCADRYYDNMDLTETVCLIQYINKNAKLESGVPDPGRVYVVPFYDITTYSEENKILFPWCISGNATSAAGPITFAIKFYKLNEDGTQYNFILNTKPSSSKILHGMNIDIANNENYILSDNVVENLWQEIHSLKKDYDIYWLEMY